MSGINIMHSPLQSFLMASCLILSLSVAAASTPPVLKIGHDGKLQIGNATFEILLFNNTMRSYSNWIFKQAKTSGLDYRAKFKVDNITGSYEQTLTDKSVHGFTLNAGMNFDQPYHSRRLSGVIAIPSEYRAIKVNGKTVELPAEPTTKIISTHAAPVSVEIDIAPGKRLSITSDKALNISDQRPYKQNKFSLNFSFTPGNGQLQECKLQLKIDYITANMMPLDISSAANRSFADDENGSGWTGQGPDNDLSSIQAGNLEKGAFRFNILPPTGKSAIVLGNHGGGKFPRTAEIAVPENLRGRGINLLHACAWPPLGGEEFGELEIIYHDNSSQHIPIRFLHDCGNWWAPQDRPNAQVVYRFEQAQNSVGLYGSGFELEKDNPKTIRINNKSGKSVWMIGALSLSDLPVLSNLKDKPNIRTEPDKDWITAEFKQDVVPGSPLDFSWIADAPAGKHGFVIADNKGGFTFENARDKHIRLFGANLCYSANFLPKDECDRLAVSLRRQGYNAVRLHHFDSELLVNPTDDTMNFNPEKLDKLDYLIAALKKEGIYITLDLISNRKVRKGAKFPNDTLKTLVPFSQDAMDNWKEFSRKLITRRNPYTGLTYAEEPAIFCVVLLNENSQCVAWNPGAGRKVFEKWKQDNNVPDASPDITDTRFRKFLVETEMTALREEIRFVREELKLKSMVSSLNYGNYPELSIPRELLDVVDNHCYFDHPGFPERKWQLPIAHTQANPISAMASVPSFVAPGRVSNKPFMITEYNYCYPNIYRAHGGAIAGAYGSLQNYSAMFRFAWAHYWKFVVQPNTIRSFDIVNDPLARLSDRLTSAMFVRNDVKSAELHYSAKIPDNFPQKGAPREYSNNFRRLALIAGVGSHHHTPAGGTELSLTDSANPESIDNPAVKEAWRKAINDKYAVSSTNEIKLDGKNQIFTVATPKTEAICLKSGKMSAGLLGVSKVDTATTVGAISLDGKNLGDSESILILHLTNTVNNHSVMNHNWTLVIENGNIPILVRRGSARITLNIPASFKVEALAFDGAPLGSVKGEKNDENFSFTADTACFPGGVMAYHLTRQN